MQNQIKSYLVTVAVAILMLFTATDSRAAKIFLDPDTVFITGGVGVEFDLDLRVDAATMDLKLYQVLISFDPAKLDTVSITEGPLLKSVPMGQTVFYYFLENADTTLRLQSLILGHDLAADGPGLLATIRLRVIDTGSVDLSIYQHELRGLNNDIIPSTGEGSVLFINYPPLPFNLLTPIGGESVSRYTGEEITLEWEGTQSIYPGESVSYRVDYSLSVDFPPGETVTFSDVDITRQNVDADGLNDGSYYHWRVTAVGDVYGFEGLSTPPVDSFQFFRAYFAPGEFDLVAPVDASDIDMPSVTSVLFDWENAATINPDDTMRYILYLGPEPAVPAGAVLIDSTEESSELSVSKELLPRQEWLHWRIEAMNRYGLSRWSSSTFTVFFSGCCSGRTGNVDCEGIVDIGDVTELIALLFIRVGDPYCCEDEADLDYSGVIDIGDLTILINRLFITVTDPPPCP